jgi:hypothetical protein
LPTPDYVIEAINAKSDTEKKKLGELTFKRGDYDIPDYFEEEEIVEDNILEQQELPPQLPVAMPEAAAPPQTPIEEGEQTVQDLDADDHHRGEVLEVNVPPTENVADQQHQEPNQQVVVEMPTTNTLEETITSELQELQQNHRYTLRPQRSNWKERYAYALTNISLKKSFNTIGVEAIVAVMKELGQLHGKKVFHPVRLKDLQPVQLKKVVRCHIFVKRKRDQTLKARLVVDGSQQERSTSIKTSSPTVSIEALFLSCSIDAEEKRDVATLDIEGAYLAADMTNDVFVEISEEITSILTTMFPTVYQDFVEVNGKLYVKLDKALYGCIESALLFYNHLHDSLVNRMGFTVNPYDPCVFNKVIDGKQCTITTYVDDLKISCADPRGVDQTIDQITTIYKKVNVHRAKKLNYLGMDLDYSMSGVVKISMVNMVEELLEEFNIDESFVTPANNNLFQISENQPLLNHYDKEQFKSTVPKLLYLAKRARPDILTAVSFLVTRVNFPTIGDKNKMIRVLKYLYGTKDLPLSLSGSNGFVINSYIDSSYGVHPDGKGHTGTMITVGRGAVYSKSGKQSLVAKSSTEAELIGLSDALSQVIWTRNFLSEQGYNVKPAKVHQDNKSTIILTEKGRPTSGKTRHISIRFFFVKDRVASKECEIVYTPTTGMVSDFYSKPLQGELFKTHRSAIMNEQLLPSQGCVERLKEPRGKNDDNNQNEREEKNRSVHQLSTRNQHRSRMVSGPGGITRNIPASGWFRTHYPSIDKSGSLDRDVDDPHRIRYPYHSVTGR